MKQNLLQRFIICTFCTLMFINFAVAEKQNESEQTQTQIQTVDLSLTTPNWATVMLGNALCTPIRNSFGYICVDDGRIVSAFTQNGNIIWKRTFSSRLKPYISVGPADMIYLISRDGDLNMLNPGGLLLWTARTGFSITEAPVCSKDGRIYVRGKDNIACYGTRGVCRWKITLKDQDTQIKITELNDGSLLVFSSKLSSGRSVGYTVSQYGQVSKEIVFAGHVTQAISTKDGTLLAFSDGGVGLCSETYGKIHSNWVIRTGTQGLKSPTYIVTQGFEEGKAALISGTPAQVILINTETGESLSDYASQYSPVGLSYIGNTIQGFVLADRMKATCYDVDGSVIWDVRLNANKPWVYMFPTDGGYLILCTTNWIMEGYRIKQTLATANRSSYTAPKSGIYEMPPQELSKTSSSVVGQTITAQLAKQMETSFTKGNFGQKEEEWQILLSQEMQSLTNAWLMENSRNQITEKPYFRTHLEYAKTILDLAAKSGSINYQKSFITLMKKVDDPSLLTWIINDVAIIAYDPEGTMLSTLESVSKKSIAQNDERVLKAICDATLEICRFMGRPAFFKHGNEILSSLMGKQYPSEAREYARKTLEKFIDMGL